MGGVYEGGAETCVAVEMARVSPYQWRPFRHVKEKGARDIHHFRGVLTSLLHDFFFPVGFSSLKFIQAF